MENGARLHIEREIVALEGLISATRNRRLEQAAKQERTDATMSYKCDIALSVCVQNTSNRLRNAFLRVGCALPPPNAIVRMSKEGIGNSLKFRGWEKTSSGTVILAELSVDLNGQAESCSQQACGLYCLRFRARPNRSQANQCWILGECSHSSDTAIR